MSDQKNQSDSRTDPPAPATEGEGRPGAGRKAGGQNKGTIKAGELREKLLRTGETPLEVLVDGMRQARKQHAKIEKKLEAFNPESLGGTDGANTDSMKELNALLRAASGYLSEARECAKDAAPYLHPRLEPMGRFLEIALPPIKGPADILLAQDAVIGAVSKGELTTDEGAKISNILEARRKSVETVEFEKRLAALEAQKGSTQ